MFDNSVSLPISLNQLWTDSRSQIKIEEVKFINAKSILELAMESYDLQPASTLEHTCGETCVHRHSATARQTATCFTSWPPEE